MCGIAVRRRHAGVVTLTAVVHLLALLTHVKVSLSEHIPIKSSHRGGQPLYAENLSSLEEVNGPRIKRNGTSGAATAAGSGQVTIQTPGGREPQLLVRLTHMGGERTEAKEIIAVQVRLHTYHALLRFCVGILR
jgi:hypothetical protein